MYNRCACNPGSSTTLAACLTGLSTNAPPAASGGNAIYLHLRCTVQPPVFLRKLVRSVVHKGSRRTEFTLPVPLEVIGKTQATPPFQSLSFDVQGAPSATENGDFKFFVVLHGTGGGSDLKSETVEFLADMNSLLPSI